MTNDNSVRVPIAIRPSEVQPDIFFQHIFTALKLFSGNENNFCFEVVTNDNSVRAPIAIRPS